MDSSAEHIVSLVDGKPRNVLSTTYKDVRTLLQNIASCPYPTSTAESTPLTMQVSC